ncbi:MAG: hypothetical protein GKR94_20625 [Gammaproteobacteria bacterium]|nr:hypothetical protein [Gammaproteobacteria bacterium]
MNTYALFAETIAQIVHRSGRAGFIVPTGIATDDSAKAYFQAISQGGRLVSLYDFENREGIFPGVHRSFKFCLLTLGRVDSSEFGFYFTRPEQLADERRRFTLTREDFQRINPNTGTCPVFRSVRDAELAKAIYSRVPVFVREARGGQAEENPWGVRFTAMFHMSNDSHLFATSPDNNRLPLYEAKMIHHYDHRWATYVEKDGRETTEDVPLASKHDPEFAVTPRYWVEAREVFLRTARLPKTLLGALREGDREKLILALAHLLFGNWLLARGPGESRDVMRELYPAWEDFVDQFPFARRLPPAALGLCGDNPPSLEPQGPAYLPAEAVSAVNTTGRTQAAWYAAEEESVQALPSVARTFPVDSGESASKQAEDVYEMANYCLETTAPDWYIGFRNITNATNERTVIASVVPRAGAGNNLPLLFFEKDIGSELIAALVANLSALVLDFVGRHKIGGTNLNFFIARQLPVLPPTAYTKDDLLFIAPRVLELTCTASDLDLWGKEFSDRPAIYRFDPDRRTRLQAELDAYYARLYGLSRDELRYVLDPVDVMGDDYPSETFRVLRQREEKACGEYRTQRLVLEAWDALESGKLH